MDVGAAGNVGGAGGGARSSGWVSCNCCWNLESDLRRRGRIDGSYLQRQLVGMLPCHVGCVVCRARLRSIADRALESSVGVPVPVLGVLQGVGVLLLAAVLLALQLSAVHPNLHLHLHNVVDARCVRLQVFKEDRGEPELSLTEAEKDFVRTL